MQTIERTRRPTVRHWTRREYYRMAKLGLFREQRVELIGGRIILLAPQLELHVVAVSLAVKALSQAFGKKYWVRSQSPLNLSNVSEPEPDVAVVPGTERDYKVHPKTAVLVVEVSVSSVAYDRRHKGSLYAAAGIADYWLLNLRKSVLEVYRDPTPDPAAPFGHRYASRQVVTRTQSIAPLAAPACPIAVADLLP